MGEKNPRNSVICANGNKLVAVFPANIYFNNKVEKIRKLFGRFYIKNYYAGKEHLIAMGTSRATIYRTI